MKFLLCISLTSPSHSLLPSPLHLKSTLHWPKPSFSEVNGRVIVPSLQNAVRKDVIVKVKSKKNILPKSTLLKPTFRPAAPTSFCLPFLHITPGGAAEAKPRCPLALRQRAGTPGCEELAVRKPQLSTAVR